MANEMYFEDFFPGQIFNSLTSYRVTAKEIISFGEKYDPQPFHLSDEGGRKSIFGRLVASGWHTAALTMRLVAGSEYRAVEGTIGLGMDSLNWPIPVLPGDELHIESEVIEKRPSNSRPDRGLLKIRTRTFNQAGQVVQELIANAMGPRHPPADNA